MPSFKTTKTYEDVEDPSSDEQRIVQFKSNDNETCSNLNVSKLKF